MVFEICNFRVLCSYSWILESNEIWNRIDSDGILFLKFFHSILQICSLIGFDQIHDEWNFRKNCAERIQWDCLNVSFLQFLWRIFEIFSIVVILRVINCIQFPWFQLTWFWKFLKFFSWPCFAICQIFSKKVLFLINGLKPYFWFIINNGNNACEI